MASGREMALQLSQTMLRNSNKALNSTDPLKQNNRTENLTCSKPFVLPNLISNQLKAHNQKKWQAK